jgi:hypothetical protein
VWLNANSKELQWFLESAEVYWEKNLPKPADDAIIVVEAFHQDFRVNLRNFAFANAIRRLHPARMVVLTGVEDAWMKTLWSGFDVDVVRKISEAFAASEVIDVWDQVRKSTTPARNDETIVEYTDATYCRLAKLPRLPEGYQNRPDYKLRHTYATRLHDYYTELFKRNVVALVTSHVDYDQWGLASEAARVAKKPIIHTQQTGCFKAYGLFPENDTHQGTFRSELTRQIGAAFEEHVWSRRDELQQTAELVAWRAKVNLGRPSWWRGGVTASVDLNNPAERARLRSHVVDRLGFVPDKPIITVYNHAVSDALGTNKELFPSLADWFADTAAYAAEHPEAQWLFLDHPSQALYDSTSFFDSVAAKYKHVKHMAFRPSATLSKNALWSLTDLGVTVRGSVSNELPAYGIPVIQAGWSEWSSCGLSTVVEDQEAYWKTLQESIQAIRDGATLVTEEQVRRARLWLWLYRSGTDIVTPLVPQWEVWPIDVLLKVLRATFRHIEADSDPLYERVERMWTRREPMLTRTDFGA